MAKQAFSMILLGEALASLDINIGHIDVRRLHHFTRECATRTAVVKTLRKAVAQFRLDPLKLLETKGIGIKTVLSVQLLSDLFAAQEVKREFGVADNLAAVSTILNTCRRGVDDVTRSELDFATNHITNARNLLEIHKLETNRAKPTVV